MADPAIESMLDRYKTEWESGRFDRLIPAFMVCAANGAPVPEWLKDAVLDDLHYAYETRRRGERSARTGAVQDRWNAIHQTRHAMMSMLLRMQQIEIEAGVRSTLNERDAAREVRQALIALKHLARGSTDAIIESYKCLENKAD